MYENKIEPIKLKSIETFHRDAHAALVRVRTEDGAEGWGQTAPANADITAQVLHRQVAPIVLGRDAIHLGDLDGLAAQVIEETYKFPGSYVCRAHKLPARSVACHRRQSCTVIRRQRLSQLFRRRRAQARGDLHEAGWYCRRYNFPEPSLLNR